jgi:D-alanine-D-alanine ligase
MKLFMEKILNFQIHGKRLGLVYDLPCKLENAQGIEFPADASAEWESQDTIHFIAQTWRSLGFEVILFPLDKNFLKMWSEKKDNCDLIHSLVEGFGSLAREAWIPALCELSGIPFIGSSAFAHSVCMSKAQTKFICRHLNIPTAPFYLVKKESDFDSIEDSFFEQGCFVKPDGEGSGMGIDSSFSICYSKQQAQSTVSDLLRKYPHGILLEMYLSGAEYTSAVIGYPQRFLPIAQIDVDTGVYGLANKGKDKREEKVTFPDLSKNLYDTIKYGTEELSSYLQLNDFVRMDWKCDDKGQVYFLEANTLAGLSHYYSVLPLLAEKAGMTYSDLLKELALSALLRSEDKSLWYGKTRI